MQNRLLGSFCRKDENINDDYAIHQKNDASKTGNPYPLERNAVEIQATQGYI